MSSPSRNRLDDICEMPEFAGHRVEWVYTPMVRVKIYFRHSRPDYCIHMEVSPDLMSDAVYSKKVIVKVFNEHMEKVIGGD